MVNSDDRCGFCKGHTSQNLDSAILTSPNHRFTPSRFYRLVIIPGPPLTGVVVLTLFAVNTRKTNNSMFESGDPGLSYPLSFPRVKDRSLRFSSGPNPNQLTALQTDFQSAVTFPIKLRIPADRIGPVLGQIIRRSPTIHSTIPQAI
jgi:hypothetical protein